MDGQEITAQPETQTTPTEDWKTKYKDEIAKEYVPVSQYKGIQRELNKARQSPKFDVTEIAREVAKAITPGLDAVYRRDSDYEDEPKRKPLPSELVMQQFTTTETKKEPQVDPMFQAAAKQVTDLLQKQGIKQGSKEWEDILTGEDGDYKDPFVVLEELQQKEIARKAKELFEAEKLEIARKAKESGATKPDGAPSAPSNDLAELRRRFLADPDNDKVAREWFAHRNEFYSRKKT